MKSLRGLSVLGISLAMVAGSQGRLSAEPKPADQQGAPPAAPPPDQKTAAPPEKKAEPSAGLPSDQKTVLPATAPSDQKTAPLSALPADRSMSPALLRGPSMYETGRVGKMGVSEAGLQIHQTHNRGVPQELRVEPKTPAPATASRESENSGVVDPRILRREIRPRFALLRDCRVEVARHKKAAPAAITASQLTLRWTIRPDGQVTDTQVVATARVDSKVMNCVKRQMSQWTFTPPDGGPVHIESPFSFEKPTR